jgi:hypothetical protein
MNHYTTLVNTEGLNKQQKEIIAFFNENVVYFESKQIIEKFLVLFEKFMDDLKERNETLNDCHFIFETEKEGSQYWLLSCLNKETRKIIRKNSNLKKERAGIPTLPEEEMKTIKNIVIFDDFAITGHHIFTVYGEELEADYEGNVVLIVPIVTKDFVKEYRKTINTNVSLYKDYVINSCKTIFKNFPGKDLPNFNNNFRKVFGCNIKSGTCPLITNYKFPCHHMDKLENYYKEREQIY